MKTKHIGSRIDAKEQLRIELSILKNVADFCETRNIGYCLAYGSLIGAVRHKGFIPWDDDIDICMLRKDYNRFIEEFPQHSKGPYRVINAQISKDYPFNFAKVYDPHTILFEKNMKKSFCGVYIDVFPLDAVDENESKRLRKAKILSLLYDIVGVKIRKRLSRSTRIKTFVSDILYCVLNFVPLCVFPFIIQNIINSKSENQSRYVGNLTIGAYIQREKYEVNIFNETMMTEFEGSLFRIPKEYDKVLRTIYGDYMILPPIEKQVPRHGTECFFIRD